MRRCEKLEGLSPPAFKSGGATAPPAPPSPTPLTFFHKLNSFPLDLALAGGYSQRRVRPPKPGEVVDLGAKFGVAVGSDSDSSDAEFAPEDEEQDSEGASGNTVFCYGSLYTALLK